LNTSMALAVIHNLSREVNTAIARRTLLENNKREIVEVLSKIDSVFNILGSQPREMLDEEIQRLIDERQEARRRRDFDRADEVRDELSDRGIILESTKDGGCWKRQEFS